VNFCGQLVLFTLDEQRYALPLDIVERTVHMVAITPLPHAPEVALGVINVQGTIIPVLDVRRRFRLPLREPGAGDQLLIARSAHRTVALAVDEVTGVMELQEAGAVPPASILPAMEYVEGVVKLEDGLVFIHDLDRFLSLSEERALETALDNA
jgi:purine-binding chemotaxis protein CheW